MTNVISLFNDTQKYEEKPVIILADDDPSVRLMIRHVLETEEVEIVETTDGLETLKAVEAQHPAIVLLDAVMPGLDGFSTCKQIRERGYTDVPVIMITGLDDEASVERAYDAGAIDFITKPIKWAVLKHRVKTVVSRVIAERKLQLLAYRDTLTDLPNRLLFADRLEQALVRAKRNNESMALMLLDIDDFKLVNDSYGHDVGDDLIKAVGRLLAKSVRRADTIARLGGDEFAVIIEGIEEPEDAISIADNITTVLDHNITLENQDTYTGASVGISVYPNDGEDSRTLLKNADTAMFRAKEKGKHHFQFYTPEMSVAAIARLDLENGLRKALEDDEFEVLYQPSVHLKSNDVVGMEALLRWNHPEKGVIRPDDFVRIAEECGLIIPIGEWVINSICKQLGRWNDSGTTKQNISINISPKQFKDQDIVALFKKSLAEHDCNASQITVEITEGTLVDNVGEVDSALTELKKMGMKVALDDFGTGFASLSYLKEFPVDVVKIDCAFVKGVPDNKDDMEIVKAIAGLTHGLKLDLLAEGVENKNQIKLLKSIGCHYGQGYYWSKPLPAKQYEDFYSKYSAETVSS